MRRFLKSKDDSFVKNTFEGGSDSEDSVEKATKKVNFAINEGIGDMIKRAKSEAETVITDETHIEGLADFDEH